MITTQIPVNLLRRIKVFSNWYQVQMVFATHSSKPYKVTTRSGIEIAARNFMDILAIDEVFAQKIYDQPPFQINPNSVVIDVGAHIGAFSLYAAIDKGDQVYSYEPYPPNYQLQLQNIKANSAELSIHPMNQGVAAAKGQRTLFIDESNTGGHSLCFEKQGKTLHVQCVTLSDILCTHKLDCCGFLKMDCEGAEYEILLGADGECLRRFRTICLEYHDWTKLPQIISQLKKADFTVAIDTGNNHRIIRAKHD